MNFEKLSQQEKIELAIELNNPKLLEELYFSSNNEIKHYIILNQNTSEELVEMFNNSFTKNIKYWN